MPLLVEIPLFDGTNKTVSLYSCPNSVWLNGDLESLKSAYVYKKGSLLPISNFVRFLPSQFDKTRLMVSGLAITRWISKYL